jgi:extradiol dioxygenase family protein
MPVAVAHIPGTAGRARAGSVDQKRVWVWSGHIVHRDDREALGLFVYDRSLQIPLFMPPLCRFGCRPRATLFFLDDSVCLPRENDLVRCDQFTSNSRALSFRPYDIVGLPVA